MNIIALINSRPLILPLDSSNKRKEYARKRKRMLAVYVRTDKRLSLHKTQAASYPGFCGMKRL